MNHARLLAVLCLLCATPALAEPAAEPLGMAALMRMTGGLLLVVALVFATAWAVRRFGRLPNSQNANLQLLGGLAVGQRERVVLIRAGDRQLVLGVAPGQVALLHALDDRAAALPAAQRDEALPPAGTAPGGDTETFQERLLGLLRRGAVR